MLDPIFDLFATVIAFFYSITHNYALAIALLTVCVMIVLLPLTLKGTKSMLELQKLQPEIKRLQQEHKGDRQKMNEEMMKLYQEHKINPLGGCLPLLLQAPVFIILYNVLAGLTRACSTSLVEQGLCSVSQAQDGGFVPKYLSESSELYQSLFGSTTMESFGIDLARPATDVIANDGLFWAGMPYLVLVIAVAATSYIQQRQITARSKGQVTNPQQQMIMRVLPGVFAVFSLTFRAGLVVYFLTANLFRIGQQAFITRRYYRDRSGGDGGDGAKPPAPPTKPAPSGKAKPAPPAKGKPAPKESRPAPKSRPPSGRTTPPKAKPTPRKHPRPAPKKKP